MAESNTFEQALQEAKKSLKAAYEQRMAIEERILSLKQAVEGLTALCNPAPMEEVVETSKGNITTTFKLSYLIRKVFADSEEYMLTPTEVRDALVEMGLDLSRYKQPLVPIHNTLKRLETQGELVAFRDDNNELRGYRWVSPLARAVAEVDSGHPINKLTMRRVNPGASNRLEQYLRLHEPVPAPSTPKEGKR